MVDFTSDSVTLAISSVMLAALAWSWWRHYIIPDGIGRFILLWFNGLLAFFIASRAFGYILTYVGVLDIPAQRIYNQFNIFVIYIIIITQVVIQLNYKHWDKKKKTCKGQKKGR